MVSTEPQPPFLLTALPHAREDSKQGVGLLCSTSALNPGLLTQACLGVCFYLHCHWSHTCLLRCEMGKKGDKDRSGFWRAACESQRGGKNVIDFQCFWESWVGEFVFER